VPAGGGAGGGRAGGAGRGGGEAGGGRGGGRRATRARAGSGVIACFGRVTAGATGRGRRGRAVADCGMAVSHWHGTCCAVPRFVLCFFFLSMALAPLDFFGWQAPRLFVALCAFLIKCMHCIGAIHDAVMYQTDTQTSEVVSPSIWGSTVASATSRDTRPRVHRRREINDSHAHKQGNHLWLPVGDALTSRPRPPEMGPLQLRRCPPSQSEVKRRSTCGQCAPDRADGDEHEETAAPACPAPSVHERTSTPSLPGRNRMQ